MRNTVFATERDGGNAGRAAPTRAVLETTGGVFRMRDHEPTLRVAAGLHRTT
jgi:hypothetical protein